MSTKEIAEALKCTQVYVTLLVKRGHFPGARKLDPTRLNSPLRIPRSEFLLYQEKQILTKSKN